METKKILYAFLKYIYRAIEIILLLSITAGIINMWQYSHDRAEMMEALKSCIGLFVWFWFIFLPIIVIVVASFIRCLIPPMSLYKKVVLLLHILNVVLLFLFYILLPEPAPCDAALMEKHYKNHHADMYDLVNYVRSSLDDSCSIKLEYRDDKVRRFEIRNKRVDETCTDIKNQQELETVLNTAGLSMQELNMIKEKMHKAGIIGIDIGKHRNPVSLVKRSRKDSKSILQFRWHGGNIYQYALYDQPVTEGIIRDVLSSNQYVLYNDSVVFESWGTFFDVRGFPDKDKYNSQHNTTIN